MKSLCRYLLPLLFVCTDIALVQAQPNDASIELRSKDVQLVIRAQTPGEAYSYLIRTLQDMEFFRANGYNVALPEHPAFTPDKPPFGSQAIFEEEVYEIGDFAEAIQALKVDIKILNEALEWFATTARKNSDLQGFNRYEVQLTLYGPGGSYDPEAGVITLFTTTSGKFKGGGGAHTIIHEMMHLATEPLVQKFGLEHWEKERLVDVLVQRELGEFLPGYALQPLGEAALDPYIKAVPIEEIASALRRYAQAKANG